MPSTQQLSRFVRQIKTSADDLIHNRISARRCFTVSGDPPRMVAPAWKSAGNPPKNFSSFNDLGTQGYNKNIYKAIAHADTPAMVVGNLGCAHIVEVVDPSRGHRYGILDHRERVVRLGGTEYGAQHQAVWNQQQTEHRNGGAWFMDPWFGNYYHWLIYSLPRVIAINESGYKEPLILPAWIPGSDYIRASLGFLGHEIESIQRLSSPVTTFNRLIVADGGFPSPHLFARLRSKIISHTSSCTTAKTLGSKLYISRSGAARRRINNESDVSQLCKNAGINAIKSEEFSFAQQVQIFRNARLLVGMHGAGLANMLWMEPGSHVIEISGSREVFPHYYQLALTLGHHYWLVKSSPSEQMKPIGQKHESDYEVDIQELEAMIQMAVRDQS